MDTPSTPRTLLANTIPAHPPNHRHPNENLAPAQAWRVRVRSDAHPGTLARFAIRLADLECSILGLTRHPAPGGVLDEFVLRPAAGLPQHLLIDALRDEGGDCLGMTETTIPDVRASSATTLAAEDPIADAARELLTPIAESLAPELQTTADIRKLPASATRLRPSSPPFDAPAAVDTETTSGTNTGRRNASAARAANGPLDAPAATDQQATSRADVGRFDAPVARVEPSSGPRDAPAAADREATSDTGQRDAQAASASRTGRKLPTEASARELRAPSTATAIDHKTASGLDTGARRVPAATALPVAGELCIGADARELSTPAATSSTADDTPVTEAIADAARREAIAETTVRGLPDSAATALVAARRAIVDPDCRAPMLRMVLSADLVTLVPMSEANPGRTEGGHRAVFAFGEGQAFVARRRWVAFAEPELAQAAAFLELLAAAAQNLAGPAVLDRPDGAAVVLRLGTPRDTDAIGAVHLRCSAKTLFNRYHTGLRTVPRKWLHRLLMPPRGTSLLAVCGRDVIGFGQLISQRDGTAEVSLLVEDAWQRQGIGTALLARLVALAGADGITELTAFRLPGNDAMARTAVRAGLRVETGPDDGTVLRLVAGRTPRTVSGSRTSLCPAPRAAPASSGRE
ncbi:GNAT family N-acetyltransferase [Amycolatopsis sp. CFH S0740]|uniref:GNAT family N-acetyltransferase n=1 Tax=unclassified Amycolatopsis TaxID=2618356 RepID=UPI003515F7F4